ncbi:MAG: 4-hydroxythreonine-4-phosphate dehydrogenase PdxA [Nitrospirota bacterium]|nr:MAG: 4-hydroxythreonine-4-phosphate dehydrogenase PdxA [Nitrospirota bacterium]
MKKKLIAITMGDPGGIGPEVVVKAVSDRSVRERVIPLIVGNRNVIREAIGLTGSKISLIEDISWMSDTEKVYFVSIDESGHLTRSEPSAAGGTAAVESIKKAVSLCLERKVHAVVTAPISKEAVKLAKYSWPGHTEMIAELTGAGRTAMMFAGPRLKVILATIHVPIRSVPALINEERVADTLDMARIASRMLSIEHPRIGVAGLNPHAGEGGMFGTSEKKAIGPAIIKARERGLDVSGPYPPDTIFRKALDGKFDIIVAMYHDQGLIPFKMIHFDSGVNTTIGLPIIRTSPDHGTAYDIAWRGVADPSSMIEAILMAERMNL